MRKAVNIFISIFLVLLSSCSLISNKHFEKVEPEYDYEVVWSFSINNNFITEEYSQDDKYLYVFEGKRTLEEDNFVNVVKIDVTTGKKLWTCQTGKELPESRVGILGDYVFFQAIDKSVVFIDKDLGIVQKEISIGNNRCINGKVFVKNNDIFWGNSGETNCILKIDTSKIDFTNEILNQEITPEYIAPNNRNNKPTSVFLEGNNIYYLTANPDFYKDEGASEFIGWNLENNSYIFKVDLPKESGRRFCSIQVIDDRIYVIGDGIWCFKKATGSLLWKKIQSYQDCMTEIILDPYVTLMEMTVYENTFLYSGQAGSSSFQQTGFPKENYKNMLCISAEDGSFLWGELVPNSGSLDVNPIVYNNKCYLVADTCLRVYDVKDGTLLGTHGDLYTCGLVFAYNDLLIFTNYPYDEMTNGEYYGVLTAIRMK